MLHFSNNSELSNRLDTRKWSDSKSNTEEIHMQSLVQNTTWSFADSFADKLLGLNPGHATYQLCDLGQMEITIVPTSQGDSENQII